ncbi:MAG: 2-oxoacid:acceptor oxidoreductase family protein [Planctomycetes bacterium]|nr:2-oxoacid:acceptor oxidoreductase family protein [Planctomycetota bacterium]
MKTKTVSKRLEIKFGGIGGQGVVYAANLLGAGLSYKKGFVSVSASYGPESRGSLTSSEVVYSPNPIDYPYTEKLDVLVSLHQNAHEKYLKDIKDNGFVLTDSSLVKKSSPAQKLYTIPASEIAQNQLGDATMANLIMVGGLVNITKIISVAQCFKALKEFTSSKFYDINRKALMIGLDYTF